MVVAGGVQNLPRGSSEVWLFVRAKSGSTDWLGEDCLSPLNGRPLLVRDVTAGTSEPHRRGILLGIDPEGRLPEIDVSEFDMLLTTRADPPSPWVFAGAARIEAAAERIVSNIERCPVAAAMLARLLRLTEGLSFEAGLEFESLAYSTLLGGAEFARWRAERPSANLPVRIDHPVSYERDGEAVSLVLRSGDDRNAMTAAMRDALFEGLVNVLEDPSRPEMILRSAAKCFSVGGDLAEFGTARDLASAHIVRMQHSCARILSLLGSRATAVVHGACIGSGIEIPAAAARRIAASNTYVQLPELGMGLIPGAGGTVTLPPAIGRHRTMWLVVSGQRLPARAALQWGLFHELRG